MVFFGKIRGIIMTNYVKDKVIIITGAGSGFGKLTSEMAADLGGKIICADIHEVNVKNVVAGIKEKGNQAEYIVTDVTKKEDMDAMAKFAVETYGRIDVLVNNAGIMPLAFFSDHKDAWKAWDQCIDINLKGVIYGISAVYDQMMGQGEGQIINISSIYGNSPSVGAAVYGASKSGVKWISDALRAESQGVLKVTTVKPTGAPSTGLRDTIINPEAILGLVGHNINAYQEEVVKYRNGELSPEYLDKDSTKYWAPDPEVLAQNIIYCINQPWGVSIGDISVRATGERYIL